MTDDAPEILETILDASKGGILLEEMGLTVTMDEGQDAYDPLRADAADRAEELVRTYEDHDTFHDVLNDGFRDDVVDAFGVVLAVANLFDQLEGLEESRPAETIIHHGGHALAATATADVASQKANTEEAG